MVFHLPELTLELSPPTAKLSSLADFLTESPSIGIGDGDSVDLSQLQEFVYLLEDELNKIQAFQRELPVSFSLLNHAIGKLKVMTKKCVERRSDDGEFGEIERVKLGNDVVEKKDWMSSVQLWSPRNEKEEESRQKAEGGTISLFNADVKDTGLSLVIPTVDDPASRPLEILTGSVDQTGKPRARSACNTAGRKRRRSWSPELHRLFVDALEKLGGSQVATPKQIRDQMQVDGLTNDEVKSHLQKHRLHIRKVSAGKTSSSIDQGLGGDKLELDYSNSDTQHSRSPESPLDLDRSNKCNSLSMEDDDEKSDGHSWKGQQHDVAKSEGFNL